MAVSQKIRFRLALWLGKLVGYFLKFLGRKGTTFPGLVAQKICPDIIKILAASFTGKIIIITGTNGKTTTNGLLASILKAARKTVAFNREGANMLKGVIGTLLQSTDLGGQIKTSFLLLEVDEGTVPHLCRQLTPAVAVITNFFPDQLDRYGEVETTVNLVQKALPSSTLLVLNADDPLVAQLACGESKEACYYGVDYFPALGEKSKGSGEEQCPRCKSKLQYNLVHYGQLGIYTCSSCEFKRPRVNIEAQGVKLTEKGLAFQVAEEDYQLPLLGFYNLYNALAAFCAAECLGVNRETIKKGLETFVAEAGRMENFGGPGFNLTLTLVKNPIGFNQVIHTLIKLDKSIALLMAINDLASDGRDVSWLWDVDFERLCRQEENINYLICSGLRAEDLALRLKYAGFKEEKIIIEPDLKKAVQSLEQKKTDSLETFFALSNYSALFPLREILRSKGWKS